MTQRWVEQELSGIDLGDARLNKRSMTLLERLADKPTVRIPTACKGWSETQAAYRFLAQDEIGWEDILTPHFSCTHERMREHSVVLCIQDTTELDFQGQDTRHPQLSSAASHVSAPTYAISVERKPLGVLDAWM